MYKSSKIYRYQDALELEQIHSILKDSKYLEYDDFDRRTRKPIKRKCPIGQIKITDDREAITGFFKYVKIEKYFPKTPDEMFHEEHYNYNFLISPSNKLFLLHGSSSKRAPVLEMLSYGIHEEQGNFFSELPTDKNLTRKIQDKIISNKLNIVIDDGFVFLGADKWRGVRTKESFSLGEIKCATTDPEYEEMFKKCTYMEPSLQVHQCDGLAKSPLNDSFLLLIRKDWSFKSYNKFSQDQWNEFVYKICKPVLLSV